MSSFASLRAINIKIRIRSNLKTKIWKSAFCPNLEWLKRTNFLQSTKTKSSKNSASSKANTSGKLHRKSKIWLKDKSSFRPRSAFWSAGKMFVWISLAKNILTRNKFSIKLFFAVSKFHFSGGILRWQYRTRKQSAFSTNWFNWCRTTRMI